MWTTAKTNRLTRNKVALMRAYGDLQRAAGQRLLKGVVSPLIDNNDPLARISRRRMMEDAKELLKSVS